MDTINIIKLSYFCFAIILLFFLYFVAKKKENGKRILGITGIAFSTFYIIIRIAFTFPKNNILGIVFACILILFELFAYFHDVFFTLLFISKQKLKFYPNNKFEEMPSIDIIISTYNEPMEILKRTIAGALNIDYPKEKYTIYLGDDGTREEAKQIAEELGIKYITRKNNEHAKAGNINNVLKTAKGEFVLLLDADMIPHRKIIKKMISYFEDSKTGFVQSPQIFYNEDPYQYNLKVSTNVPNDQDFFMRIIEEKRAEFNSVLHIGTNAIFRRKALDDIGGIPTGSITEDMATGMLIQNKGYKSFYINQVLAIGLSPDNLVDFIKQRDRWCRGNVQVMKKYNPLKMDNLTFMQKMIYFDGFSYWSTGLQKLVFLLAPLLFLFFKLTIISASFWDLAIIFIPHFLSSLLFFRIASKKTRNIFWSHIYELATAPHLTKSFLLELFFNKKPKFNVTPKGNVLEKNIYRFKLSLSHLFLFILSVVALSINVKYFFENIDSDFISGLIINMLWCIYNIFGLIIVLFLFMDRFRFRTTERIILDYKYKVSLSKYECIEQCKFYGGIEDISEKGIKIALKTKDYNYNFAEGDQIKVKIETLGEAKATIKRIFVENERIKLGLSFENLDFEMYKQINELRFKNYCKMAKLEKNADSFFDILKYIFKKKEKNI